MSEVKYCAVDVGTSTVSAAIAEQGATEIVVRPVRLGRDGHLASAAVFVTEDGFVHGDAAERLGLERPTHLLRDYKHRIGDGVPLTVPGLSVMGEELFARTVEWAARTAAAEGDLSGVTVTVPARWGEHRRSRVRDALSERDLPPTTLLSEPEAAALHFAASHAWASGTTLAVCDLGAGTFDLAFVRIQETPGTVTVLHTAEIPDLSGADFDDRVLAHVLAMLDSADRAHSPDARAVLRRDCVAAKESLSFGAEAAIPVPHAGTAATVRLVRSEFEMMIEGDIIRTGEAFTHARVAAGLEHVDIEALLLAGGSSRIPAVAQLLSHGLDAMPCTDVNPKGLVARGAARAAMTVAVREQEEPLIPTPIATARAGVAPPTAATLTAIRPARRWRNMMSGTAAAAFLVGGVAVANSFGLVAAEFGGTPTAAPAADGATSLAGADSDVLSAWDLAALDASGPMGTGSPRPVAAPAPIRPPLIARPDVDAGTSTTPAPAKAAPRSAATSPAAALNPTPHTTTAPVAEPAPTLESPEQMADPVPESPVSTAIPDSMTVQ